MPQFVILTHDHPFRHWDFMLERHDALRTWRLLTEPHVGTPISAETLPDHRKHYLDYEGPVSNNRGEVWRWDWGEYTYIEESNALVRIHLNGQKLCGDAVLERDDSGQVWTFHFRRQP